MYTYTTGNIIKADVDALVNTVNTVGIMGIRSRAPSVNEANTSCQLSLIAGTEIRPSDSTTTIFWPTFTYVFMVTALFVYDRRRTAMKNWRVALKYLYREHTAYNLLFTALCVDLLVRYGAVSYSYIFWLKVVGFVGISVAYYWSRKKHLYFFYNLGLNTRDLILFSLVIDTTLSLVIFTLTNMIAH